MTCVLHLLLIDTWMDKCCVCSAAAATFCCWMDDKCWMCSYLLLFVVCRRMDVLLLGLFPPSPLIFVPLFLLFLG